MWTALAILVGLAAFLVVQVLRAPKTYRPLASRQPERQVQKTPLGMEGLDLDEVGRTNRRNESLERGQTNWLSRAGFFGRPDTAVEPLADDETYAARFHAAFQKDTSKDTMK